MNQKKQIDVTIAFLGNALNDSRIINLKNSLEHDNCTVSVIAFEWIKKHFRYNSNGILVSYISREKSLFFYLNFAKILIKNLKNTNSDIYFAEDIYTLPFVTYFAKRRGKKVYYNSRELYMHLGGLRNRKYLQWLVTQIEKYFIKKVDKVLVTGWLDAEYIQKFYGIKNTVVIRNIPLLQTPGEKIDLHSSLSIPNNQTILLYVGVLIDGRGLPQILKAMSNVANCSLVVLGDGENRDRYEKLSKELGVNKRVFFLGTKPQQDLIKYTSSADIGLALIENISISYYHALPNKLFEYIMAELPVLSCNLPQMKQIVEKYNVGKVIDLRDQHSVESTLKEWVNNLGNLKQYKQNCKEAAKELNWQEEYKRVREELISL